MQIYDIEGKCIRKNEAQGSGIETVKSIHNGKIICIFVFNTVAFY